MSTRAEAIEGLRMLADLLEQNPDMPLPYQVESTSLTFHFLSGSDAKERMAALARLIPGTLKKSESSGQYGDYFDLYGQLAGLKVHLTAYRDQVCARVVTGTREVTKTIPDPMVVVPVVEVTETVEDVRWECHPLLREPVAEAPVCAHCPLPAGHTGDHAPAVES